MTDPDNPIPAEDGARPEQDGASAPSLPPPAFPPGSRRYEARRRGVSVEEDAISAREPISLRDELEDALISPDDPMPHRAEGGQSGTADEGLVMGMGNDPHLAPEELVADGDPHLIELIQKVGKLAQALRQRGEAGLRAESDMDRFDTTLRAYCVGYLAGRRAQEEQ